MFVKYLFLFMALLGCTLADAASDDPMRALKAQSSARTACLRLLESGNVYDKSQQYLIDRLTRFSYYIEVAYSEPEVTRWKKEAHRRLQAFRAFVKKSHDERMGEVAPSDEEITRLEETLLQDEEPKKQAAQEELDALDDEYGLEALEEFAEIYRKYEKLNDRYEEVIRSGGVGIIKRGWRRLWVGMREIRKNSSRFTAKNELNGKYDPDIYKKAYDRMVVLQNILKGSSSEAEIKEQIKKIKDQKRRADLFMSSPAVIAILKDLELEPELAEGETIYEYMGRLGSTHENVDLDILLLVIQYSLNNKKKPPYMTIFDDVLIGLAVNDPQLLENLVQSAHGIQQILIRNRQDQLLGSSENHDAILAQLVELAGANAEGMDEMREFINEQREINDRNAQTKKTVAFWVKLGIGVVLINQAFWSLFF